MKSVIRVRVLKGRDLLAADLCGTSDPYCVIKYNQKKVRTKVVPKTLNPVWNQELVVELQGFGTKKSSVLCIECWDKDSYKFDDPLGKVEVNLGEVLADQEAFQNPRWYKLEKLKGCSKVTGELKLSFLHEQVAETTCPTPAENVASAANCKPRGGNPTFKETPECAIQQDAGTIMFIADIDSDILCEKDLKRVSICREVDEADTSEGDESGKSVGSTDSFSFQVSPAHPHRKGKVNESFKALALEEHLKRTNVMVTPMTNPSVNLPLLVFQKYDVDKDGTISREEFFDMARDLGYHFGGVTPLESAEAEESAFKILDQDGSSKIELDEFVEFWRRENRFRFLQLDEAGRHKVRSVDEYFSFFDKEGTKRLNQSQFRIMYDNMVLSGYTLDSFEQCWRELDLNGDGFVHLNELLAFTIRRGLLTAA